MVSLYVESRCREVNRISRPQPRLRINTSCLTISASTNSIVIGEEVNEHPRRSATSAGLQLFVYQALRETADRPKPGLPGISGLMHSSVDRLRYNGADPQMLELAERISLTLHSLRNDLGRDEQQAERLRNELDDLTCEWLLQSPLPISAL